MTTTTSRIIAGLAAIGVVVATGQASAQSLQLTTPMDASMTCDQINAEIARMDQVMGVSSGAIASAEGAARGAEAAASLGVNAALYSGALGRVPGLGMFANAAAAQAKASAAAKAQREGQNIQIAQQRRAIMSGLYQGKGCNAATPVSMTMTATTPAAAPAAPVALSTTQDVSLRASAAPTAAVVGAVKAGGAIYPTGNRNGVWMEVDDENGSRGWMSSAFAKAR